MAYVELLGNMTEETIYINLPALLNIAAPIPHRLSIIIRASK